MSAEPMLGKTVRDLRDGDVGEVVRVLPDGRLSSVGPEWVSTGMRPDGVEVIKDDYVNRTLQS